MFYIYLQVLFRGQAHGSCLTFREPHSKNFHVVLDHGLDARLVVHVLDEFFGGFVSHIICLDLVSLLASKEILHIYRRDVSSHYFKNVQSMRCLEQCSARKTYPKLGLDMLRLVGEYPAIPIRGVGDGGIVGPRVGRLDSSTELHQAREFSLIKRPKMSFTWRV